MEEQYFFKYIMIIHMKYSADGEVKKSFNLKLTIVVFLGIYSGSCFSQGKEYKRKEILTEYVLDLNGHDSLLSKRIIFFNEVDSVLSKKDFDNNGKLIELEEYVYESASEGKILANNFRDFDSIPIDVSHSVSKYIWTESFELYEYTRLYDSKNRISIEVSWNRQSEPLFEKKYFYDLEDNILRIEEYSYDAKTGFSLLSIENREYKIF